MFRSSVMMRKSHDTDVHDHENDIFGFVEATAEGERRRNSDKKPRGVEKLLCVGVVCVDVIDQLDEYPSEDAEVRSKNRFRRIGGNGANLAMTFATLPGKLSCSLMYATKPNDLDSNAAWITKTLQENGVGDLAIWNEEGELPVSHIIQCPKTRTIVHYRSIPEITFQDFIDHYVPYGFSWIHFEGRPNVDHLQLMMQHVQGTCTISLEIEKKRDPDLLETLLSFCDVIIVSKAYLKDGTEPQEFLESLLEQKQGTYKENSKFVVTCGEKGAYGALAGTKQVFHVPPYPVDENAIIDTIGAGDTFNAALIHALIDGHPLKEAIEFANEQAAKKITKQGLSL